MILLLVIVIMLAAMPGAVVVGLWLDRNLAKRRAVRSLLERIREHE